MESPDNFQAEIAEPATAAVEPSIAPVVAPETAAAPPDTYIAPPDTPAPIVTQLVASPPSLGRKRTLAVFYRLGFLAVLVIASIYAARAGLQLRRWTWSYTNAIHFYPDMNNGYFWGSQAGRPESTPQGYLNVYDRVASYAGKGDDSPEYGLDYAPLRLLLMSKWVGWTRANFPASPDTRGSQAQRSAKADDQYKYYWPLLEFNTWIEVFGTVGIFLLTQHWSARRARRERKRASELDPATPRLGFGGRMLRWLDSPKPFPGWIAGYIAALLFWFNPAVIVSAHGWPTWDMWIIPFFIWAVYLASVDLWFCAGLMIAVGAMFKGQQLFIAPMFVLWPLFAGQPMKALRWAIGLLFGVAVIASPWLVSYVPSTVPLPAAPDARIIDRAAIAWITCVLIASLAMPFLLQRLRPWRLTWTRKWLAWSVWSLLIMLTMTLVAWPFMAAINRDHFLRIGLPIAIVVTAGAAILSFRRCLLLAAGAVGTSLLLCALLFNGNFNWLYIGWGYGTRHYYHMTQGPSDNVAGLLNVRFGWNELTDKAYTLDPHPIHLWPTSTVLFEKPIDFTIRDVLVGHYGVTFLLSVIAMAIQYRRNDPKFLIAIVAPWLMFFTYMPQIHERYLLYAAGVGCCLTAVSCGATLLNLFLILHTTVMTLHVMLINAADHGRLKNFATDMSPTFKWSLRRNIENTHPDAAWAVILCSLIFLYLSFTPTRQRVRPSKLLAGPELTPARAGFLKRVFAATIRRTKSDDVAAPVAQLDRA